MLVRAISESDFDAVVMLVLESHRHSVFSELPVSIQKVSAQVRTLISRKIGQFALVAETPAGIAGGIHCALGQHIICDGDNILAVQNLLVSQAVRKGLAAGRVPLALLSAAAGVGARNGAKLVTLNVTSGIAPNVMHKIAKKIGMQPSGGNYIGKIRH